jgi:hypothetical protein
MKREDGRCESLVSLEIMRHSTISQKRTGKRDAEEPIRRGGRFRAEHQGEAKDNHRGEAMEPRRTTTEGEANTRMGALPRPAPRNGSTAKADTKEWERPTPRNGLERRRNPAPRNPKDGGTKRQPTINKKWSDRKKEKVG